MAVDKALLDLEGRKLLLAQIDDAEVVRRTGFDDDQIAEVERRVVPVRGPQLESEP